MTTTADLVSSASAKIGAFGSAYYFVPETGAVAQEHGLDIFRLYFLGRGGVLGNVEPSVVAAAFGYFEPGLIEKMWITAQKRSSLSPREAGTLYFEVCGEFGRRNFANVDNLQAFCDAAEKVSNAVDPAGLALYAGLSVEPLAEDLPARAMQLIAVLREFKGGVHLMSVVTSGLSPKIAHGVRRPDFWQAFGYSAESLPTGTDEEQRVLDQADELTARLITPVYGVLTESEGDALEAGLTAMGAAMPENASIQLDKNPAKNARM
ncbi:SCO6745 family protein [Antrihabitans cavernicola]|uniref:EvbL n=1 Tax=Antrihabitans cavernicola TaxID=2495913 RepID=A0A5A7S926_9NOCA|nr:hypothetical protein [Spelaeibacter cavernicola]KAA0021417.1 hypothetical protein FOY51_19450 [Spelaeibacter cavernicola]